MRFVLDVNLPDDSDVRVQLGRMLRYWGGAMKDFDAIEPGDKQDIYDSAKTGSGHGRSAPTRIECRSRALTSSHGL